MRTALSLGAFLYFLSPAQLFAASKLDGRLLVARQAVAALPRLQGVAAPDPIVRFSIRLAQGARKEPLAARHPRLTVGAQLGPVVSASAPLSVLDELETDGDVASVAADREAHKTNDVIRSNNLNGGLVLGALKNGLSDLGSLDGSGVIMGIVDTGIDWTHADFVSGGQSRIISIWDQNDAVGPKPAGFAYGSEYLQATLTANLTNPSCTAVGGAGCPVRQLDTNGHGTHVAGTAGGNGLSSGGGTYSSLAPKVQFIIVNTNFRNTGIQDAVSYIQAKAGATPFVINLSLGENSGPHDGTDSFETAIDAVAASHPVAVAMGNDQLGHPHAHATIGSGQSATFTLSDVGTPVDPFGASKTKQPCLNAEFWHPAGDHYTVTVTPNCAGCAGSASATFGTSNSPFATNGVQVFINNDVGLPDGGGGDQQIFVQVEDHGNVSCGSTGAQIVTSYTVSLTNTALASTGRVDAYTDPELVGIQYAAGTNTTVDTDGTLTEPASARNVFAVAAHTSRNTWPASGGASPFTDNGVSPGSIASFSDHGPSRDGRQKPDVAAGGEYVLSTKSKDYSPAYPNVSADGFHTVFHGTSQATPAVASALATRLQVNPSISVAQLKLALHSDAQTDAATGTGASVPNTTWGYGKLLGPPLIQAAPTSLSITGVGVSSIGYSWALAPNATSYNVVYSSAASMVAGVVASPLTFSLPQAPNTSSAVKVCGVNGTGQGPCAVSASTVTLPSAIPGLPAYSVSITTIGVDYTACPAAQCSGYIFQASQSSTFLGTVFSVQTNNPAITHLEFPLNTLSPSTLYFMRVGTLNSVSASSMTFLGSATTKANVVAPGAGPNPTVAATSLQFFWNNGGNTAGQTYTAVVSTASDFSGTTQTQSGVDLFSAAFSGLSVDTSYYFKVGVTNGPILSSGPVSTLAVAPAAIAQAFSGITQSALRVGWAQGADPAGALYQAQISLSPTLSPVVASSITYNLFADFGGLGPNTTYYAQAQAIGNGGQPTSYTILGGTSTLAQPLAPAAITFTNAFSTGFTVNFLNPSDPPGTLFIAQISTSVDFGVVAASSRTYNTFASFSGLKSNATYYFAAAALNNNSVLSSTSAFFNPVAFSTVALPSAPAAVSPAGSTQTVSGLFVNWGAGGNALPSSFTADLANNPSFTGAVSSTTRNLYAGFSGLTANTLYYARALTVNNDPNGPPSPTTLLGTASTLPNPPGVPAQPLVSVTFGSVTVNWNGLPAAPPAATCEGYRLQASTDPGFGTIAATVDYPFGATSGGLAGLSAYTTYTLRIGAVGFDGSTDYALLGTTRTLPVQLSSGVVTAAGLQLSINPTASQLLSIQVMVPPGVFPPGTVVSVSPSVAVIPPPGSNQASMTAIGTAVSFTLDAGGLQPNGVVSVMLGYDPNQIPAAVDPKTIQLARYDTVSGQWTLQQSFTSPPDHMIIAQVGHFSLFQPFAVNAAQDLGNVNIFPIPWEPTSDNQNFNGPFLTISNLPANARVRFFTISGEQVWHSEAAASGVLTWSGLNDWGRVVGSGTYLVVIDGAGRRITKRVVIAR